VFQAWIDESEDPTRSVFMMGGFVAPAENWARFSDQWRSHLGIKEFFHMKDEHNVKLGETTLERDRRLEQWLQMIEKLAPYRAESGISIPAYKSIFKGNIGSDKALVKDTDNIYFWTFHEIISGICKGLINKGHNSQIDIYFDCNEIYMPRVDKEKFYWMARKVALPEIASILPPKAKFKDDKKFMPLQAADMMTWLSSKSAAQNLPADFCWLQNRFDEIEPVCDRYLREDELALRMKDSQLDPAILAEWQEKFG